MMRLGVFRQRPNLSFFRRSGALGHRCFTGSAQAGACEGKTSSGNGQDSRVTGEKNASSSCTKATASPGPAGSMLGLAFWSCRSTWKRAGINTFRCLVGCTSGDFSALWMLQSYYPEMAVNTSMALSMASGIMSSILLETVMLRRGADNLSWPMAARTAMGMSMVSMIAMELAENVVDYHLTGGVVALHDPSFWVAAVLSVGAGFLAPLPYNYIRLKKYGKACH